MQKYKSYSNFKYKFRIDTNVLIDSNERLRYLRYRRRSPIEIIRRSACIMHCYKRTCLPHPRIYRLAP